MNILGISGSLRKASLNSLLIDAAAEVAEAPVSVTRFDLDAIPLYSEDLEAAGAPAAVVALKAAITDADALLLATPEYNYSISGVLKNAIDWASRPAFDSVLKGKPTGILSASMAFTGGVRAQQHLKTILSGTLTPVYTAPEFLLTAAHNAFDGEGRLQDEATARRLATYVNGLGEWAGRG